MFWAYSMQAPHNHISHNNSSDAIHQLAAVHQAR